VGTALSEFIRHPEVSLWYLTGQQRKSATPTHYRPGSGSPGSLLPFSQGMTVLDLVLIGRGVTDFAADARSVYTARLTVNYNSYGLDLGAILTEGDMKNQPTTCRPVTFISLTCARKQLFRGEL